MFEVMFAAEQPETAISDGNPINWSLVAETIALGFAAEIPAVGGAVAFLIGNYWPGSSGSIWSSIEAQVQTMIDAAILAAEYESDKESIDGLKTTMQRYLDDAPPEKGATLVDALGKADDLFSKLTESSNNIHLIPLTVVLSHLHLLLLAEQQQHGTVIFSEPGQPPIPSNPAWDSELTNQRIAYHDFFRMIYPAWWAWRKPRIYSEWGRTWSPFVYSAHGKGQDDVAGLEQYYDESGNSNSDAFRDTALAIEVMYDNRAKADMANALASTFLLNLYDPTTSGNLPDVDPNLAYLTLGPFCPATLGTDGHGNVQTASADIPGAVVGITIHSGNTIDGFQLHYSDHEGVLSGPDSSGGPGLIPMPTGAHCTGFETGFVNGIMFLVKVHFSDGSVSPAYGNAGGWQGPVADATVGSPYALYGAHYAPNDGPSGTWGTGLVTFKYVHASLLRRQIKSVLCTGQYLATWDYLVSENGQFYCVMQSDANLCTYAGIGSPNAGPEVWNSGVTDPGGSYYVIMQGDGNLCIYAGEGPPNADDCVWQSGATGPIGDYFAVLDDANKLSVYGGTPNAKGGLLWASS